MSDIATLISQVQLEAQREEFPIDIPVYKSSGLDPTYPVLYAGNLNSDLCFFARDLGKDEVYARQPLIGAAGTLVRQGFYQALYHQQPKGRKDLQKICDRVLLSNTVPYKPPGNKAYAVKVKERFRPFVEKLLVLHWQGSQIITLGTEAFKWFTPYGAPGEIDEFFQRGDRFSSKLSVTLNARDDRNELHQRQVTLLPLPHPSPLNKQYYEKFPQMLQQRLNDFEF